MTINYGMGWRMALRRLGVKLGLIREPLIPDYQQHREAFALEDRVRLLVAEGLRFNDTRVVHRNSHFVRLYRIMEFINQAVLDQIPEQDLHRKVAQRIQREALEDVMFSPQPFLMMFEHDEQANRIMVVRTDIFNADFRVAEGVQDNPSLACRNVEARYRQILSAPED